MNDLYKTPKTAQPSIKPKTEKTPKTPKTGRSHMGKFIFFLFFLTFLLVGLFALFVTVLDGATVTPTYTKVPTESHTRIVITPCDGPGQPVCRN